MKDKRFIPLILVLYVGGFGGAFNNNLMNVAMTGFMAEFGVDSTAAQWTISGYMIVTLVCVCSMAFFFRRFKLRPLFFFAQACNIVGGVLCMFAPSFPVLVAARLIQGVGTGVMQPIMMNSILIVAKPQRRGTMMAIASTIITLAPAFAPAITGAIATSAGWRMIFVPSIVLAVLLGIAGIICLKNINEAKDASFDVPSAILLVLGLVPFAFGLTRIASAPVMGVGFLAFGAVILVVFGWRQLRLEDPLLNIRPLGNHGFWPMCITTFCALMTNFSICMVLPLYFQNGLALAASVAGMFILIPVLFNTVSALVAGPLLDRFGCWPLIPAGMLLMLASQFLVAFGAHSGAVAFVVAASCVGSTGVGLASSPSQTQGLSLLERKDNPHGVALSSFSIQFAGAMAPALYIGVMGAVQASRQASGAALGLAAQSGASVAFIVAAGVTFVGGVIATIYCWHYRKR